MGNIYDFMSRTKGKEKRKTNRREIKEDEGQICPSWCYNQNN